MTAFFLVLNEPVTDLGAGGPPMKNRAKPN